MFGKWKRQAESKFLTGQQSSALKFALIYILGMGQIIGLVSAWEVRNLEIPNHVECKEIILTVFTRDMTLNILMVINVAIGNQGLLLSEVRNHTREKNVNWVGEKLFPYITVYFCNIFLNAFWEWQKTDRMNALIITYLLFLNSLYLQQFFKLGDYKITHEKWNMMDSLVPKMPRYLHYVHYRDYFINFPGIGFANWSWNLNDVKLNNNHRCLIKAHISNNPFAFFFITQKRLLPIILWIWT